MPMPREIPSVPDHWQQFLSSLLVAVALPLSPLVIDKAIKGYVPDTTLFLTVALYILAIAGSSRSTLMLGLSIFVGGGYLLAYGYISNSKADAALAPDEWIPVVARYAFVAIFVLQQVAERYNRHVAKKDPFWPFRPTTGN
ncbi:hypothetical protein [Caenispirillum bisanense]|uniref:Uncharacterized protein n=1 Tax=Caenispirillum bisanense TaxID=414052 RepID=A0A286GLL9_9PROT|nr:hypothetical protein [Caenispirillum bisanense]SOD96086.1 hypothetical protein SAMN05421508_105149 [Caenispirillum bisanense]